MKSIIENALTLYSIDTRFLRLLQQTTFENIVTKEEISPAGAISSFVTMFSKLSNLKKGSFLSFKIYLNVVCCKIAVWGVSIFQCVKRYMHILSIWLSLQYLSIFHASNSKNTECREKIRISFVQFSESVSSLCKAARATLTRRDY